MIEIVPFASPYLEAVGALIVGIQRDEFQIPITLEDQPDLKDIPAFYQRGAGNFWVALSECEIVGTVAVNHIVNTAGIAFVARVMKTSGKDVGAVFSAFFKASEAAGAAKARAAIHAEPLDAKGRQAKLVKFEADLGAKVARAL